MNGGVTMSPPLAVALDTDRQLLATIIQFTREWYELHGAWPTADTLRQQLGLPAPSRFATTELHPEGARMAQERR
jgi:hypothetical protein